MLHILVIFALYLILLITDLSLQVVKKTANGYMRLLFDTKITDTQKSKLLQITSYIISVYLPMCVKIYLNPHAPEKPTNMIFIRNSLLDFRQQHTNLVDHCLKPVLVKHFCSWMNPINVTLNVHSKGPAFQAKHLKDLVQQLPGEVDTKQLAWKRAPIRSYFGFSSKAAPCLQIDAEVFWNSIDNHNRSCERYIGLTSRCLSERFSRSRRKTTS